MRVLVIVLVGFDIDIVFFFLCDGINMVFFNVIYRFCVVVVNLVIML